MKKSFNLGFYSRVSVHDWHKLYSVLCIVLCIYNNSIKQVLNKLVLM